MGGRGGGESFTPPMLASFLSWEFLLNTPCWFYIYLGSFSYTSRARFTFMWGVSLTHPVLTFTFMWGVSLTYPMLTLFLCVEFLLHVPCCPNFYLGSFSSTSYAGFIFIGGGGGGGVLLCIPCWLSFCVGSFHYTSRAGFICYVGSFSYTFPFCPRFCLESLPYTSRALFTFIWGVSLTHPMLTCFYVGSFSYTSRVALIFMWEFGVTHPCWFLFFIFISGVSLTHPILTSFLSTLRFCGEFLYTSQDFFCVGSFFYSVGGVSSLHTSHADLLHIPCWFLFFIYYYLK